MLAVLLAILFLSGCGSENQAKKTAEGYMNAVKQGDQYEAFDADVGFIDVFDYEYLQTLEESQEKDTTGWTYEMWESVYGDASDPLYPSFESYKESELEYIESQSASGKKYEVIQNDNQALEYWDGESYNDVFKFLYNVEIANETGQKVYKKAEITVKEGLVRDEKKDEYVDGFVITEVYIR